MIDATGNRLGDYLSGTSASGVGSSLTFLNPSDERVYRIDTWTGAYAVPQVLVYFETNDCSGPGYVLVTSDPWVPNYVPLPQNVFVQYHEGLPESPGDPMYVTADTQQTITGRSENVAAYCRALTSPYTAAAYAIQPIGTIPVAKPAPIRIG